MHVVTASYFHSTLVLFFILPVIMCDTDQLEPFTIEEVIMNSPLRPKQFTGTWISG